jgi:hypothetical protein
MNTKVDLNKVKQNIDNKFKPFVPRDIRRQHKPKIKRPHSKKSIIVKYNQCKEGARTRGLDFELTLDDFEKLWQKPCVYCGTSIDSIGIDRMDNECGYLADNIVACCWKCNRMKTTMTVAEFISHARKIAKYDTAHRRHLMEFITDDVRQRNE